MQYAEFTRREAYSKEELLALSQGNLVVDPPPEFVRLPAPPMLMIDRVVDYSDRSTAVLWGDGTSAAVVSKSVPSRVRVVATSLASSPAGHGAVTIPRSGHFAQDGNSVQRFAIKTTLTTLAALLPAARERVVRTRGRVRFIGHQANGTMLDAVARRANIDPGDHWFNIVEHGNTGAAGAPTVLSQHWDALADGDTVLVVVVGAGLTWASVTVEIGEG